MSYDYLLIYIDKVNSRICGIKHTETIKENCLYSKPLQIEKFL